MIANDLLKPHFPHLLSRVISASVLHREEVKVLGKPQNTTQMSTVTISVRILYTALSSEHVSCVFYL